MQIANKLLQFMVAVNDMPKAKEFYADMLGLTVVTDVRQSDDRWWVSLNAQGGGSTIVLSTYHERMTPGALTIYFTTSDVAAAHKELTGKGVSVNEIKDDLYGPGSGVKWFNMKDPDGNVVYLAQG